MTKPLFRSLRVAMSRYPMSKPGDYVRMEGCWWEVAACVRTARLVLMKVGLSSPPARYWVGLR